METLEVIMTVLTMFGMLVWLLVSLSSIPGKDSISKSMHKMV